MSERRIYAAAWRRPLRMSRIGGTQLHMSLSLVQVGVFVAGFVVLFLARGLVVALVGDAAPLVVVGVPAALAFVADRARVDGRDPLRAAYGWAAYAVGRFGRERRRRGRARRPRIVTRSTHHVEP